MPRGTVADLKQAAVRQCVLVAICVIANVESNGCLNLPPRQDFDEGNRKAREAGREGVKCRARLGTRTAQYA